jgi:hypothetical protein
MLISVGLSIDYIGGTKMEERFHEIGQKWADDFTALNPDITFNVALCTDWAYAWFRAECSDSYEVTIREQSIICAAIRAKYGNIKLPMKLATRSVSI